MTGVREVDLLPAWLKPQAARIRDSPTSSLQYVALLVSFVLVSGFYYSWMRSPFGAIVALVGVGLVTFPRVVTSTQTRLFRVVLLTLAWVPLARTFEGASLGGLSMVLYTLLVVFLLLRGRDA